MARPLFPAAPPPGPGAAPAQPMPMPAMEGGPATEDDETETEGTERVTVLRIVRTLGPDGAPLYSVEKGEEPEEPGEGMEGMGGMDPGMGSGMEMPLMASGGEEMEPPDEGTDDVNVILARVAEAVDADAKTVAGGPTSKEMFDSGYNEGEEKPPGGRY